MSMQSTPGSAAPVPAAPNHSNSSSVSDSGSALEFAPCSPESPTDGTPLNDRTEDNDRSSDEYNGSGEIESEDSCEDLVRSHFSEDSSLDANIGVHDNAADLMNTPPSDATPSHSSPDLSNIPNGNREVIVVGEVKYDQCRREELGNEVEAGRLSHEQDFEYDESDDETPFPASSPFLSGAQIYFDPTKRPDTALDCSQKDVKESADTPHLHSLESVQIPSPSLMSSDIFPPTPTSKTPGPKLISPSTATTTDTPFTSTLKYFNSLKNHPMNPKQKENKILSSHKARRNASLPEEIAELAKEMHTSDGSLDKDSNTKFTPLELVMEGNTTSGSTMADTVNSTTKVAKNDMQIETEDSVSGSGLNRPQMETTPSKLITYELNIPSSSSEQFKTCIQANASTEVIADFIRLRGEELDAPDSSIDEAVQSFLEDPESFVVDNDRIAGKEEKEKLGGWNQVDGPVFIKVVGMLPVVMFWVAMKPVAWCADKVYGTLVEKMNGLGLGGKKKDA